MHISPKLYIKSTKNQLGISYIEIMIVVVILAIVAVVALPNSSPTDTRKLDLAAQEVAQAIRFTRAEAIRTAIPYGIVFKNNLDNAKVYRLLSAVPTYDIYHPVDKKIYTLNLKTDRATEGVDLLSHSIYFQDVIGNKQYLGFSDKGIPKYYQLGNDHMLSAPATITLSYAGQTRIISVSPMTGRVTVQ